MQVVDTQIVHPNQFSFFLNSHAGIQGTSRCAKYLFLLDQNRFGADELQASPLLHMAYPCYNCYLDILLAAWLTAITADLQAFTYNQTYTFARCTRSVSICPPAYCTLRSCQVLTAMLFLSSNECCAFR